MKSICRAQLTALAFVVLVPLCNARFTSPDDVPVERVLKVAEAELAKDVNSARAHYTLARIHYLAFSRATGTVPAFMPSGSREELGIPSRYLTEDWLSTARWEEARKRELSELGRRDIPTDSRQRQAADEATRLHFARLQRENWRPPLAMNAARRAQHATAALKAFDEAIRIQASPLYLLGLASLQEEIVDWKNAMPAGSLPAELTLIDPVWAQANYFKAFRGAYPTESRQKDLGLEGLIGLVSHEAGVGYLRLSARNMGVVRTDGALRDEIEAALAKLRTLPQGLVTPIIFTLEPAAYITSLLAAERHVNFDLRGFGSAERWSWLQPTTALLVWDPAGRGEIVSGRQLFGGYTFQIFRETGYEALAALDDDRNGELRGPELAGLRAWFDRNGDGRSEAAEVGDLADLGIVGIDVRATGKDGIHPTNPAGLKLRDGGTLPTWDWIVAPVAGPN